MDFGISAQLMKKVKEDSCLRYEGKKNPSKILDMVTGEFLDYSDAHVAFICLPTFPKTILDNLGMSVYDARNTILTCEEVKEKLYSGEICLLPTDAGIQVRVLNPELLKPGPQQYVHRNRRTMARSGATPAGQVWSSASSQSSYRANDKGTCVLNAIPVGSVPGRLVL